LSGRKEGLADRKPKELIRSLREEIFGVVAVPKALILDVRSTTNVHWHHVVNKSNYGEAAAFVFYGFEEALSRD
jgi:hypothetical protein